MLSLKIFISWLPQTLCQIWTITACRIYLAICVSYVYMHAPLCVCVCVFACVCVWSQYMHTDQFYADVLLLPLNTATDMFSSMEHQSGQNSRWPSMTIDDEIDRRSLMSTVEVRCWCWQATVKVRCRCQQTAVDVDRRTSMSTDDLRYRPSMSAIDRLSHHSRPTKTSATVMITFISL